MWHINVTGRFREWYEQLTDPEAEGLYDEYLRETDLG